MKVLPTLAFIQKMQKVLVFDYRTRNVVLQDNPMFKSLNILRRILAAGACARQGR